MLELDTERTLESTMAAAKERLEAPNTEAFLVVAFDNVEGPNKSVATTFYGTESHLLTVLETIYELAPELFPLFAVRMMQDKLSAVASAETGSPVEEPVSRSVH